MTLTALAAGALIVPATIWFCAIGAVIATGIWLYASLRDVDVVPGGGPPEVGDDVGQSIGADSDPWPHA